MSFTWTFEPEWDESALADLDLDRGFDTREDAQEWLSQAWADLADAGVTDVTLLDGTMPVYTMSLDSQ
ncbi:MAG: hypothetical protein FWF75_09575 [Propionibacteriaceae bacterium]|nr:hypothetical protein [Propionibacteriaceae bacterium]